MLKPVLQVAGGAAVAVLLWKLAAVLLLPLLGIAAGILVLLVKILLFGLALLVVWLMYRWVTRASRPAV